MAQKSQRNSHKFFREARSEIFIATLPGSKEEGAILEPIIEEQMSIGEYKL